jgi:hypothetical protein
MALRDNTEPRKIHSVCIRRISQGWVGGYTRSPTVQFTLCLYDVAYREGFAFAGHRAIS